MNKLTLVLSASIAAAAFSHAAFAVEYRQLTEEESRLVQADAQKLSPADREKRAAAMKIYNLHKTGGRVRVPGTPRGAIRIVNLQKRVPTSDLAKVTDSFRSLRPYDIAIVEKDVKAEVKIVLSDDATSPSLAIFPDEGRAVVNVAKLADKKTAEKPAFLAARIKKEIVRAFAYLTAGSTYGTPIFNRIPTPADLDDCAGETFPMDVIMRSTQYLSKAGVVPAEDISYKLILKRGFDIAPTNEFQRVIYEQAKKDKSSSKKK